MVRLSSVLISHFLLDLQEAHQRMEFGDETNDHSWSASGGSVVFASALGSLGATIDPAQYLPEENDGGTY